MPIRIIISHMAIFKSHDAIIAFREAIAAKITDWEPMHKLRGAVRGDRASLMAIDDLASRLSSEGIYRVRELYYGWASLSEISFGLDENIPDDDEPYFRVGNAGIDAATARVRENPMGVWVMTDRWGDGIYLAVDAAAPLSDAAVIPDEWD